MRLLHYSNHCVQKLLIILTFNFLLSFKALCWENFPEFQTLTDAEVDTFEGPSLLSSEYTSDLLTYGKPSNWEYLWLTHTKALEMSFGSLNTTRFAIENRLKVQMPISPFFEIRLNSFDESNLERQSTHAILELIFWMWSKLGFVFYGEPSFRKPKNDTGMALLIRPSPQHEIRIFNSFIDVTRLKYPDSSDTFIEPHLPYARGIVGRAWSQPHAESQTGHFMEYAFRYETPTTWQFFEQNTIFRYWKWFTSLYGRYQFLNQTSTALRFQFDRKYESKTSLDPTLQGTGYTNRLNIMNEETFPSLGPQKDWDLTVGLMFTLRQWKTNLGTGAYNDLLPYFRIGIPAWGPPQKKDHWILGYILTWHRENGDPQIGIRLDNDGRIEQRLNLSYEFSFGEFGKLVLLASADLDKLGSRASWSGGCGQLQLFF